MGVRLVQPRVEGSVSLPDGRHLSFVEFGRARGRPVFWFHGTPGARRQIPNAARLAALERGVRLIGVDRPGVGRSTPHLYGQVLDFAADFRHVTDQLGVEECAVVGMSGGGPYALACSAAFPDRVTAAAVLGGVAPTAGPDAIPGGLVNRTALFRPVLNNLRTPAKFGFAAFAWACRPFAFQILDIYARTTPQGDRRVIAQPDVRTMIIDDFMNCAYPMMCAPVFDLILFWQPWGFSLRDIGVPVHFWHGDADNIVPLEHGQHMASLVKDATVTIRPDESHLGAFAAGEEVIDRLLRMWNPSSPYSTSRLD